MNKEYVQQYAGLEKKHWWFTVRQKIITGFISRHNPEKKLKLLNIGAAGGASSQWLSAFGEVTSVENDPFFLEHLQRSDIQVVNASIEQLPFDNESFDLVCAFDVIEHVENDKIALQEMTRVCRRGGMICITVPAFQSLWSEHDVVNGHQRRYVLKTLKKLVATQPALEQLDMAYFNSILFASVYAARKMSSLFRSKKHSPKSDFENFKTGGFSNKLLQTIFGWEVSLLKRFRFPAGVSLIAVLKKRSS